MGPSLFQGKRQVFVRCGFALLLFQWCGCASHLATVKTIPAPFPTGLRGDEPLGSATKHLIAAEHEQPSVALGYDLLAAKISYGVLERQPKDESARSIYNFAVARVGRGDTPDSSDGVVPYWRSHLPGAQSELIVNADHGAQYDPQAIAEVE